MKKEKYNPIAYLNILKFVGSMIIAIILHYHCCLLLFINKPNPLQSHRILWYLSLNGYVIVEMFFMISGMLFAMFYLNKVKTKLSFESFIKKRYIRIFPILIITTIYMYILNYFVHKYTGAFWNGGTLDLWELLCDILLGGKAIFGISTSTLNVPIWYINILMICYIIAYIIAIYYKKYEKKWLFVIPIIVGITIKFSNLQIVLLNSNISRGLISFFIGTCLAFLIGYIKTADESKKRTIKKIALIVLTIFIIIEFKSNSALYTADKNMCYNLLFFPELIILLYDCKWINKLCSTKFITFLGNISFGIYLWNFPILITTHLIYKLEIINIPITSASFLIVLAIIHIIVATLSYYMLESKITNYLTKNRPN